MLEWLSYAFLKNAVMASLLVSVACGIVGTYVVIKRITLISGGVSHAAFGGIGIGYFLGTNPILAAIPFSLLSALGIGILSKKARVNEDTAIGIVWTLGMSIGIIFIGLTPGYAPDLFTYLFGSILTVPSSELLVMLVLDVIIIIAVLLFYKEFLAVSFDEDFSRVVGVPTSAAYLLLLCLVALSVVVLIRAVGIILLIALLSMPAGISRRFTYDVKKVMLFSIFVGALITLSGLALSFIFDLASGATIVISLSLAFLVTSLLKRVPA